MSAEAKNDGSTSQNSFDSNQDLVAWFQCPNLVIFQEQVDFFISGMMKKTKSSDNLEQLDAFIMEEFKTLNQDRELYQSMVHATSPGLDCG